MGLRSERCRVSDQTINKLLPHANSLENYGFRFSNESRFEKNWHEKLGDVANVMLIVEVVRPGTVRDLVRLLKKIQIPHDEILRLRLDEPEVVTELYKDDAAG